MASTAIHRSVTSATTVTKFTLSMWVKRSKITDSTSRRMFTANGGTGDVYFRFNADDKIEWSGHGSNASSAGYFITNRLFRDPSAWYHLVIRFDSTQGSASNRLRFYVNGTQEESFSSYTDVNQNATDNIVNTSMVHRIGGISGQYFDGLLTHVHFTQGYSYAASDFGETDSTSGIWVPKASPSVTYGNNGFFLKFENSGAMGTDSSGNTNTFSTTSGNLTQNVDTPSIAYNTLNLQASHVGTGITISNGGNSFNSGSTVQYGIGVCNYALNKGKWYYEYKMGHTCAGGGIGDTYQVALRIKSGTALGNTTEEFAWEGNGYMKTNNGQSAYGSSATAGDIIGQYIDLDNNKMYVAVNGTIQNSGTGFSITDPDSLSSGYYYVGLISDQCSATANVTADMNYGGGYFGTTAVSSAQADANGQGIFEYSPNNGGASSFDSAAKNFYALNTKNIQEFG